MNDKVREKISKSLGTDNISIAECQLDDISLHISDGYDYFIATINRQHLLQDLYSIIGELGQLLVIDTEGAKTREYDWEVYSPCGMHYLNFSGLLKTIIRDGIIVDLESTSQ
ncbi:MAG: hypothetical protein WCJ36_03625 [Candidatus Saccharibacteria bacterium]